MVSKQKYHTTNEKGKTKCFNNSADVYKEILKDSSIYMITYSDEYQKSKTIWLKTTKKKVNENIDGEVLEPQLNNNKVYAECKDMNQFFWYINWPITIYIYADGKKYSFRNILEPNNKLEESKYESKEVAYIYKIREVYTDKQFKNKLEMECKQR